MYSLKTSKYDMQVGMLHKKHRCALFHLWNEISVQSLIDKKMNLKWEKFIAFTEIILTKNDP